VEYEAEKARQKTSLIEATFAGDGPMASWRFYRRWAGSPATTSSLSNCGGVPQGILDTGDAWLAR